MGKLVYIAIVIIPSKRKTLHCELLWKLVTVNSLELKAGCSWELELVTVNSLELDLIRKAGCSYWLSGS